MDLGDLSPNNAHNTADSWAEVEEGKGPEWGRGKKKKEEAKAVEESSSDSSDEQTNLIQESCYMTANTSSLSTSRYTCEQSQNQYEKVFHTLYTRTIIDSGSTTHIENDQQNFDKIVPSTSSRISGIGGNVEIIGRV